MGRFFFPTHFVESVVELAPERLRQWGLDSLLLDADCTLKRYSSEELEPEIARWLEQVQQSGIALRLLSNGLPHRIGQLAQRIQLPFTARALKPLPYGVKKAMAQSGFDPHRCAMVGDQIFADILAGNLAGIQTILVEPIHPEEEHWFTRIKRPPERFLKRWISPK